MITVHSVSPGIESKPYLPAGTFLPPIITSSPKVIVVALLAPVLQTFPYGTRSPKILRPFTPGREYEISMLDKAKFCLMFAVGLGCGVVNCWASLERNI